MIQFQSLTSQIYCFLGRSLTSWGFGCGGRILLLWAEVWGRSVGDLGRWNERLGMIWIRVGLSVGCER